MDVLLVALGAMAGAPLRYLVDRWISARHDTVFPWGTFTVNVAGSLVLGLVTGAAAAHGLPRSVVLLAGTGFCGALTTFSTFGYETVRLVEDGAYGYAAGNVLGSAAAGLMAVTAGYALATSL
ncbi:fluoride efflux transporter CrcB [Carbonactinospora thermoautotrophica]|uniref:Fluoride-specific ion channel FluC n=1 Tax=Carbonactinospora thermoautotrophica TaxID=1469144 RepID=A0A132MK76_9ACTN|nr:fluoride efflux transporter CrcB [Carbonactinospora thermoautotrophica]KWW98260.1 chromosome condensation protein CrcB [Carbonactinospora thermoautotrophica]KWX06688.1 chromosome condensation protein CrcB [Carbonactinospora thermoautotrophica]MCX9193588.1 fluoride efflux transporter CrcB [Carbonactinospora thermoautotrophica]